MSTSSVFCVSGTPVKTSTVSDLDSTTLSDRPISFEFRLAPVISDHDWAHDDI